MFIAYLLSIIETIKNKGQQNYRFKLHIYRFLFNIPRI